MHLPTHPRLLAALPLLLLAPLSAHASILTANATITLPSADTTHFNFAVDLRGEDTDNTTVRCAKDLIRPADGTNHYPAKLSCRSLADGGVGTQAYFEFAVDADAVDSVVLGVDDLARYRFDDLPYDTYGPTGQKDEQGFPSRHVFPAQNVQTNPENNPGKKMDP